MIHLLVTSLTQFPRVAQRVKIHAGRVPCRGTAAGRGDQRELWGRVPIPEPQALHISQPGSLSTREGSQQWLCVSHTS